MTVVAPRVAIVSLVPDSGHVIPLLRIGVALQRAGVEIACFLPDTCEHLRGQYPLAFHAGAPIVDAQTLAWGTSFQASRMSWLTTEYLLGRYYAGLSRGASAALPGLLTGLRRFGPDVILADPHAFADWHKCLAAAVAATLVLHHSEGSLRPWQDPVTNRKGRPVTSAHARRRELTARLEEQAERLVGIALSMWAPPEYPHLPAKVAAAAHRLGVPRDCEADVHSVTTGIAVLEAARGDDRATIPAGVTLFGPVGSGSEPLPGELAAWLRDDPREVVYVSFGTMLRVDRRLVRAMCDALAALGLRGLWSIPRSQLTALADVTFPSHVRVEPHVPQREVLQQPEVRCCVTHAGAGTLQESLWAGKPMVCMPALWDQFYNAAFVVRSGAGLQVSSHERSIRSLQRAIGDVVRRPSYRAAAARLHAAFSQARGGERIVDFVQALVRRRRSLASGPTATS